jgi:VWFA-related protein
MRSARSVVAELTLISLFAASCGVAYCQDSSPVSRPAATPNTQTQADPVSPVLTLRVTSRLVYIDVTVRDSHGQFVRGLTQQDFKLFEDGNEQNFHLGIHSKDPERVASGTVKPETTLPYVVPLGQKEFSNVPQSTGTSDSISMVLLDLLSTPQLDQLYARQQLLAFLKAMPRGQQMALFVLSDRLHMIQPFTGFSDRLIAAAEKIRPKDLTLIHSQDESAQDADWVAEFVAAIGRSAAGAVKPFEPQVLEQNAERREYLTEAALRELARATAGYPGRKNLLWLAESFPIAIGSQLSKTRYIGQDVVGTRMTSEMLANSRIAIYPISLLGLEAGGVNASANGVGEVNSLGGAYGKTLNDQTEARHHLRELVNEIARETGGHAFYGTNDFVRALESSLDDGSNYYAIAYAPSNSDWNGHFRNVEVKLQQKGYTLSYRRGYFAFPDSTPLSDINKDLSIAMQPMTPQATMLLLKSKILPSDLGGNDVIIESTINPDTVTFTTTADGHHHAKLLVTLIALNDGETQPRQPPQSAGNLNIDLDPARYDFVLHNGIAFQQRLPLVPGKYRLRLGVVDDTSHRIGTIDVPVSVGITNPQP